MRLRLLLHMLPATVFAVSVLAVASCASTESDVAVEHDAANVVSAPDAAVEASDAPKVEDLPPCGEGHLCSVPTPLTFGFIVALAGRSRSDVWASGTRGVLMHWTGQEWSMLDSGISESLSALFLTRDEVWGVAGTLVLRRGLDPASVRKFRVGEFFRSLSGLAVLSTGETYLSYAPEYYKPTTPTPLGKIVDFDTAQIEFAEAPVLAGTSEAQELNVRAAYLVPDKALWLVGDRASVARYPVSPIQRGVVMPVPSQARLLAAWGYDDHLFAVGSGGAIVHYDGASWHIEESGTNTTLNAVFGVSANDVWAVGDEGTALHFDGRGWSKISLGSYRGNLRAVWGSSPDDVWIGGEGAMFHWGALR